MLLNVSDLRRTWQRLLVFLKSIVVVVCYWLQRWMMGEIRNREIYEWSSAPRNSSRNIRDYRPWMWRAAPSKVAIRGVNDTARPFFYFFVCTCTSVIAGSLAGLSCLFLTGTLSTTVFRLWPSSSRVILTAHRLCAHSSSNAVHTDVELLEVRAFIQTVQIKQNLRLETTSQQTSS